MSHNINSLRRYNCLHRGQVSEIDDMLLSNIFYDENLFSKIFTNPSSLNKNM